MLTLHLDQIEREILSRLVRVRLQSLGARYQGEDTADLLVVLELSALKRLSEVLHLPAARPDQDCYKTQRLAVLEDPASSYWLRDSLTRLDQRDPVDVLHDLEKLLALARLRAKAALGQIQENILESNSSS